MTQEEIVEMAQECRLIGMRPHLDGIYSEALIAFAKLVAAKAKAEEREACARVCEIGINNATDWDSSDWDQACENRAYHIRARGEQA